MQGKKNNNNYIYIQIGNKLPIEYNFQSDY